MEPVTPDFLGLLMPASLVAQEVSRERYVEIADTTRQMGGASLSRTAIRRVEAALRHPRLDGPVAYVGGHELAPLLRDVRPGTTTRELAHSWRHAVPHETGSSLARWLARHRVLVPVEGA
jgi:hypothetical protein